MVRRFSRPLQMHNRQNSAAELNIVVIVVTIQNIVIDKVCPNQTQTTAFNMLFVVMIKATYAISSHAQLQHLMSVMTKTQYPPILNHAQVVIQEKQVRTTKITASVQRQAFAIIILQLMCLLQAVVPAARCQNLINVARLLRQVSQLV